MKKLLSLALALLMVLTMTGCGSSGGSDTPKKEVEFQLGTVEKGVYKNPFLGIGFKLDESGMHEEPQTTGNYRTEVKPEDLDAKVTNGIMELMAKNYEGNNLKVNDFNWLMSIEVGKDVDDVYDPTVFMSYKETQRVESASQTYENIEHKPITKTIAGTELTGFELLFTMKNYIQGGEYHLFLKKGQYCYYVSLLSVYYGEDARTPDQIRENLDSMIKTCFFGL